MIDPNVLSNSTTRSKVAMAYRPLIFPHNVAILPEGETAPGGSTTTTGQFTFGPPAANVAACAVGRSRTESKAALSYIVTAHSGE